MALRVKICGLRSPEAVEAAAEAGADLVGFVSFPPSPRDIPPDQAARIAERLPAHVKTVAVTVDATDDEIDHIARTLGPAFIQMHGTETPERVAHVARHAGIPAIKALRIAEPADVARAEAYDGVAAMLLFDARPPQDASRPGGHGIAFDWSLARAYPGAAPWILSGGLDAGNVAAAIRASGAGAVDVSSGVESAPGVKDPDLIRAFLRAAREAELMHEERA